MTLRRAVLLPQRQFRLSRRLFYLMTHKKGSAGLAHFHLPRPGGLRFPRGLPTLFGIGSMRLNALVMLTVLLTLPASAEWNEKVLHSFQGGMNDGSVPAGGVIFDSQGNLYGATTDGGPASCKPIGGACGTVFQLSPPTEKGGAWTETVIYRFQGKGSNDGSVPNSGLIRDAAGNLYGITAYGGTGDCVLLGVPAGCGTVYELSPSKQKGEAWKETILYSFPTSKQGYLPNGNLVFDWAGNLYGATTFGGDKGTTCDSYYGGQCGVVFELSPPTKKGGKWRERVLHNFAGGPGGTKGNDGAEPSGGLVFDSKGALYGTTYYGGNEAGHCDSGTAGIGCGTVFNLTPPAGKGVAWTEKVILRFNVQDGTNPAAGVVFDRECDLYGTTVAGGGGNSPSGTVFKLTQHGTGSWTERVLYSFQFGDDGANPLAGIVLGPEGKAYGTASVGGANGGGTLFRLKRTSTGWAFTVLYSFTGTDNLPVGNLVLDATGNLYGTTEEGGNTQSCAPYGCGAVFEASP